MARSAMARIASLLALLALAGCAHAARTPSGARSLLQNDQCDTGCTTCQYSETAGKVMCTLCKNNMRPATDGTCGCPAGQYRVTSGASIDTCVDCEIGFYCPGGTQAKSIKIACDYNNDPTTVGLTTRFTKSKSRSNCVNMPGYSYTASTSGAPTAVACAGNTFSVGLRRQKACTPCPAKMVMATDSARTSSSQCRLPQGFYQDGAFGKITKCPKGEWYGGGNIVTKCNTCKEGVTTKRAGMSAATDCNINLPGYAFKTAATNGRHLLQTDATAQLCPQKSFCPGGTDVNTCGSANNCGATTCTLGRWTRGLGARSEAECLVPPGHYFDDSTAQTVKMCSTGELDAEYQPFWGKHTDIKACLKCGTNFRSEPTVPLDQYNLADNAENSLNGKPNSILVRGSETSCYILKGMGVVANADGTYTAQYCTRNSYGAEDKVPGRDAEECRQCPLNTVTDNTFNYPSDKPTDQPDYPRHTITGVSTPVFFGPDACLARPGYSYDGNLAFPCAVGSWSAGFSGATKYDDVNGKCTPCPEGTTTLATSASTAAQCNRVIEGYGYDANTATVAACDFGFFGKGTRGLMACTACPSGRNTSSIRAASEADCNVCNPGLGFTGEAGATTQCTACEGAPSTVTSPGTYGPADRKAGDYTCKACPSGDNFQQKIFYQTDRIYTPRFITAGSAKASDECVLEFAQIVSSINLQVSFADAKWTSSTRETDQAGCINVCRTNANCQLVQFIHATTTGNNCFIKAAGTTTPATADGRAQYLVATQMIKNTQKQVTASSLAGAYTFWEDTTGSDWEELAKQADVYGVNVATVAACLQKCTDEQDCAAAAMAFTVGSGSNKNTLASCAIVRGNLVIDNASQTLLRSAPGKASPNALYLP